MKKLKNLNYQIQWKKLKKSLGRVVTKSSKKVWPILQTCSQKTKNFTIKVIWPRLKALPTWAQLTTLGLVGLSLGLSVILMVNKRSEEKMSGPEFKRQLFGPYAYASKAGPLTTRLGHDAEGVRLSVENDTSQIEFKTPLTKISREKKDEQLVFETENKLIKVSYRPLKNGVKEEIILSGDPNTNQFASTLSVKGVEPKVTAEGQIVFVNSQGEYQYHLQEPWAKDSTGDVTYGLSYKLYQKDSQDKELTQKTLLSPLLTTNNQGETTTKASDFENTYLNPSTDPLTGNINYSKQLLGGINQAQEGLIKTKEYVLVLEVDSEWLNSPDRVYPLTIDPTVVHDESSEFSSGELDRVTDTGSGSSPQLESYYQELPADEHTVALYHMDNDWTDSSGNGNNGSANGGATFSTDTKFSSHAGSFDGTDDYVNLGNDSSLNGITSKITIEAWVYPETDGSYQYILSNDRDCCGTYKGYSLSLSTGFMIWDSAGSQHTVGLTSFPTLNKWHHVAATYDGSNMNIYLNGELNNSLSWSGTMGTPASFNTYIGGMGYNPALYNLQGKIDEVRISNIARTPEEIKAAAQRRPSAVYTSDVIDLTNVYSWNDLAWTENGVLTGDGETLADSTDLVAHWKFNETSGTTADNAAGSCGASCDGTLTSFSDTTGQDVVAGSGWTSDNGRWPSSSPAGLMFDGTNDYVDMGDSVIGSGDKTVSLWMKMDSKGSNYSVVFTNTIGLSSDNAGVEISYSTNSGADHLAFSVGNGTETGSYLSCNGVNLDVGTWYNVVLVQNSTALYGYVNGQEYCFSNTTSGTESTDANNFRIGTRNYATDYLFEGVIDNVSVYNRALTASEIIANYNSGNLQFQTRVGSDTSPNDGDWTDWSPTSSETQILSFDDDIDNWQLKTATTSGIPLTTANVNPTSPSGPTGCSSSKAVLINNLGNEAELTNYQVKLNVDYLTGMASDFSDLRFTNDAGTDLDYWLEEYTTSTDATVWIEVDSIPKNSSTNIFMWYNGCTGGSSSNGDNTFDHYDDFSTNTLSEYTQYGDTGPWSISGGNLVVADTDSSAYSYLSYAPLSYTNNESFAIDSRIQLTGSATWGGFVIFSDNSANHHHIDFNRNRYADRQTGTGNTTANLPGNNTWYESSIRYDGNSGTLNWYKDGHKVHSDPLTGTSDRSSGSIGFISNYVTDTYLWDYIRVRKYSDPEPSVELIEQNQPFIEDSGSMKVIANQSRSDSYTVALYHFDETNGDLAGDDVFDASGNGNDGEFNGTGIATGVVDGIVGKAREFDYTSSDVIALPSSSISSGNEITISFWAYGGDALGSINNSVFEANDSSGNRTCNIHLPWSNGDVYWDCGNSGTSYDRIYKAVGAADYKGKWTHWAFTKNASAGTLKIYLNGSLWHSGTGKTYPVNSGGDISIGSYAEGTSNFWDGKLDEFKIDSVERTAEEIAEAYRAGRDHYLNRTISSTNLSSKQSLPFYVAGDLPGTYLEATAGESAYANHQPDNNTVGLWHMDETRNGDVNLLDNSTWTVGSGDTTGFSANGNASENYRLLGNDPTGGASVLWEARPDSTSGPDGGWNGSSFNIDNTKKYRFSVWVQRPVQGNGHFYLGTHGYGSVNGVYRRSDGSNSTNPYFTINSNWGEWGNNSSWYLAVGHVWPSGSGTGSNDAESGIYDTSGNLIYTADLNDFVWRSETTTSNHRSYLFYSTNTATRQRWVYPRVDIVDGTEPSIDDLVANGPDQLGRIIKDVSGKNNAATTVGFPHSVIAKYGKARYFDGIDDYLSVTSPTDIPIGNSSYTIEAWIKPNIMDQHGIVGWGNYGTTNEVNAFRLSATGLVNYWWGNDLSVTANLDDGNWHHVAASYDGSTRAIYVDGQLKGSDTPGSHSVPNTTNFRIGSTNGGEYFDGSIDEVRISDIARSAEEIRQAYEVGQRTHPITIDFAASLDSGNLIANSGDTSFTVDATSYGLSEMGSNLYLGDKIIVQENYGGTEYIAQGTVTSVTPSTGTVTVASWDTGSTFPGSGFTAHASVFKWQREYFDLSGILDSHIDSVTNLTLRFTNGHEGRTVYLDDLRSAGDYLTTSTGSTITSPTDYRYFQYRAILTSSDPAVSASFDSVTLDYEANTAPTAPTSLLTEGQTNPTGLTDTTPEFSAIYNDSNTGDIANKYQIQVDDDSDFSSVFWDSGSSGTSMSDCNKGSRCQDISYGGSALSEGTTYYWRIKYWDQDDYEGSWSTGTNTFDLNQTPSAPTSLLTEAQTNPTGLLDATPEFSAIYNDGDSGNTTNKYQIQVDDNSDFSSVIWDSGAAGTSMTNCAEGTRCQDISYAGSSLSWGETYYWRIKFWDQDDYEGVWSTESATFTMNKAPNIPSLDSPLDEAVQVTTTPTFKTTTTDDDGDYVQYKITICEDAGMTTNCQTFDQTSSQAGWSGQNAGTGTAYTSGTQASYTVQDPLPSNTTLYWKTYALDPAGTNTWSDTQATPRSFTTIYEHASECTIEEATDDSSLTLNWSDNSGGELGYEIKRSVNGGAYTTLTTKAANSTSHVDNTVSQGNTYQYQIAPYWSGPVYSEWCTTAPARPLSLESGHFYID